MIFFFYVPLTVCQINISIPIGDNSLNLVSTRTVTVCTLCNQDNRLCKTSDIIALSEQNLLLPSSDRPPQRA